VFAAASLAFFFLNMATFAALAVVLFTMVAELHWSYTAAGFSFSLLGLACGLSSPLPALSMRWAGGRITMCIGALMLVAGFILASLSQGIIAFYVAMTLLGLGYSFAGNVPGVYLISGWFKRGASRIIGFYMMLGALGAAVGPRLVLMIVNWVGWRGQWQVMAAVAAALGVICFALVRDPQGLAAAGASLKGDAHPAAPGMREWDPRKAVFTPQFALIACAMIATMAGVTTNNSILVNHLAKLGGTAVTASYILGGIGLVATFVKALSGWLSEKMPPSIIVATGLTLQSAGHVMLAFAATPLLQYGAVFVFGTGWGLAFVAGTIVLLDYFGSLTGSKILSVVWLLTSAAAVGPIAAGAIADAFGTFAPIFLIYAILLLVLAVPILLMRRPVNRAGAAAGAIDGGFATTVTAA
jgi:MFS family permease